MTKESVFIDAQNGGIGVYIGAGNKVGFAKTAKMLKYILDTKNINVFEAVSYTHLTLPTKCWV